MISVEEPLGAEHRAELGAEDLEGDLAIVLQVAGEVDDGHAAGAELALDDVAVVECGCDQRGGVVAHGGECGAGGGGRGRAGEAVAPSCPVRRRRILPHDCVAHPTGPPPGQHLGPVQRG